MDRKDFFTKSCQCGIASFAGLFLLSNNLFGQTAEIASDETEVLKYKLNFSRQRFSDLIKHLDGYLDEATRHQLYQKVGDSCASTYTDSLSVFKGNLQALLDEQLKQDWLKEYQLNESKGELKLIGKPKSECGCPLVKKGLTPIEFCNCSVGHMKKVYEVVTQKKVQVKLESSILMGNEHCNFTLVFS